MEPKAAFISPLKGRKIKQSRNLSSGCFLLLVFGYAKQGWGGVGVECKIVSRWELGVGMVKWLDQLYFPSRRVVFLNLLKMFLHLKSC